jgi:hypothetical protein
MQETGDAVRHNSRLVIPPEMFFLSALHRFSAYPHVTVAEKGSHTKGNAMLVAIFLTAVIVPGILLLIVMANLILIARPLARLVGILDTTRQNNTRSTANFRLC